MSADVSVSRKPIIAGLLLSMFLVALDGTIVSTAMPSIVGSLGGFGLYAWVPSIYLLTTAVSTPIYGKLADLYGRKPILFVGIGLFLAGSVLSGAAPNMPALILFRAVQGLGAGAVMPINMTIVADIFTLEQRARMQGVFSSVWGISSVAGPLVGGLVVDNVGWRWIFYLNLPIGLAAVLMISAFFHERTVQREHKLDIAGATYLALLLTSVLLVLIEGDQAWPWLSGQTAGLVVVALICLWLFIRTEQQAIEPVLPLDIFRSRIIAVSALGTLFAGVLTMNVSYEVPLYVQGVLGQDAVRAGLALMPLSIGWPLAGAFSGRLCIRYGYQRTATTGMGCCTLGAALLLTLGRTSSVLETSLFAFIIGVGLGLSSTPMLIAVQSAVDWSRRGIATGTNMFVRSFGGVIGLAVMGAVVNHSTAAVGGRGAASRALDIHTRAGLGARGLHYIQGLLMNGIHLAFMAVLAAAVLGFLVVTRLPGGSAIEHEVRETPGEPPPAKEARGA